MKTYRLLYFYHRTPVAASWSEAGENFSSHKYHIDYYYQASTCTHEFRWCAPCSFAACLRRCVIVSCTHSTVAQTNRHWLENFARSSTNDPLYFMCVHLHLPSDRPSVCSRCNRQAERGTLKTLQKCIERRAKNEMKTNLFSRCSRRWCGQSSAHALCTRHALPHLVWRFPYLHKQPQRCII